MLSRIEGFGPSNKGLRANLYPSGLCGIGRLQRSALGCAL